MRQPLDPVHHRGGGLRMEGGMEMESVTDVTQVVLAVSMVTMLTSAGQKPLLFRRTVGALGGTWR